jgi:hypothetical protein
MATQAMMFKVGATQSPQLAGLAGKSYVASKVTTAGTGLGKLMFLTPVAEGGKTVALKIEGTRQIAELSHVIGKTVTVGKSPTVIGGMSKWLVLTPGSGGAVTTGATAGGAALKGKAAASSTVMMKLEGTRQAAQLPAMSGKSFTVIKSPMAGAKASSWLFMKPAAGAATSQELVALQIQNGAGNFSGLIGKTYTISKAPMAAGNGAGNWVLFQPAKGVAAKAAAGAAATTKSATTKSAATKSAATKSAATKSVATKGAVKSGTTALAGKSTTAAAASNGGGGVIWNGTGWKLGLGMGFGAWGPVLLVGALAATGVGIYGYMKSLETTEELD